MTKGPLHYNFARHRVSSKIVLFALESIELNGLPGAGEFANLQPNKNIEPPV